MSASRSCTPSSTSMFLATITACCSAICFSCMDTNLSREKDSSTGSVMSCSRRTVSRLRKSRFSTMSLTLATRSSKRISSAWNACRYASMFIEVHVRLSMPGWMTRSSSARCGLSSGSAMGMMPFITRSYSEIACERRLKWSLNFSSCASTILALSGTSCPIRIRHLVSRSSCRISRSKLTCRRPVFGCLTKSVACRPDLAASMPLVHARCQSVSNSTMVRAILLYTLMSFFDSLVAISAGFSLNCSIGLSMRRISWRAHITLPVTGGELRTVGGDTFCFSYRRCTVSRSTP
mmetsp:Transcript_21952/g.64634  ORF Transcript_21952/g.64634 Transcript_21952/m.64634 type:complete len:292 (-) Transcript_21952:1668-2543(-)